MIKNIRKKENYKIKNKNSDQIVVHVLSFRNKAFVLTMYVGIRHSDPLNTCHSSIVNVRVIHLHMLFNTQSLPFSYSQACQRCNYLT